MGESSLDGRAWVCGARGQEFESLFSPYLHNLVSAKLAIKDEKIMVPVT